MIHPLHQELSKHTDWAIKFGTKQRVNKKKRILTLDTKKAVNMPVVDIINFIKQNT